MQLPLSGSVGDRGARGSTPKDAVAASVVLGDGAYFLFASGRGCAMSVQSFLRQMSNTSCLIFVAGDKAAADIAHEASAADERVSVVRSPLSWVADATVDAKLPFKGFAGVLIDLGAASLPWRAIELFAQLDAGLGEVLHEIEDPLLRCRLAEVLTESSMCTTLRNNGFCSTSWTLQFASCSRAHLSEELDWSVAELGTSAEVDLLRFVILRIRYQSRARAQCE